MSNKIVRTVCVFTDNPDESVLSKLDNIVEKLETNGYMVQTRRVASTVEQLDGYLTCQKKVSNTSVSVT